MGTRTILQSLACLGMLLSSAASAAVLPSEAVAGERVLLATTICQGGSPTALSAPLRLAIENGALHLRAQVNLGGFAVASCLRMHILSDPVPAGTYDALFSYEVTNNPARPTIGPERLGTLTVAAQDVPATPLYRKLSGNWFDPAAPGTGVNLVQGQSGALFAAWLTHPPLDTLDYSSFANGTQTLAFGGWYVMSEGRWISPTVFRGPLFATRAQSSERVWDAAMLTVEPMGFASFTFVGPEEVRFEATLLYGYEKQLTTAQTLRRFRF